MSCVDRIVPNPDSISFIRESEPLQIFVFFKPDTKKTNLSLSINNKIAISKEINLTECTDNFDKNRAIIHKLGIYKLVKKLIYNSLMEGGMLDDIYLAKVASIEEL